MLTGFPIDCYIHVSGDIAQLGERRVRNAEAGGSNPPISTNFDFSKEKPMGVAYAALYFASDESAFVTGASLLVDGGSSASFGRNR